MLRGIFYGICVWFLCVGFCRIKVSMQTIPHEKYTLPNGLRLILVPMSGVSSVATAVMVGWGVGTKRGH